MAMAAVVALGQSPPDDCPDECACEEGGCTSRFYDEEVKNPFTKSGDILGEDGVIPGGSTFFRNCQKISSESWPNLVQKVKGRSGPAPDEVKGAFQVYWKKKMGAFIHNTDELGRPGLFLSKGDIKTLECTCPGVDKLEAEGKKRNLEQKLSELIEEAKGWHRQMKKCVALVSLTSHIDYSNEGQTEDKKGQKKKSFDGRLTCQSMGAETQDYPACATLIDIYNGAFLGQKVVQGAQTIGFSMALSESQDKAREDPGDITAPWKMQKNSIDKQQEMATQRSVFHGAKLAALLGAMSAIPSREDLVEKCKRHFPEDLNNIGDKEYKDILGFIGAFNDRPKGNFLNLEGPLSTARDGESHVHLCWQGAQAPVALLMNQGVKDVMTGILIEVGVDVGTNIAAAHLLGERSKQVQGIIDGIEDYNPEDEYPVVEGEEVDCLIYPESLPCQISGEQNFQQVGLPENKISIDGGEGAAIVDQGHSESDESGDEGGRESFATQDPDVPSTGAIIPEVPQSNAFETFSPKGGLKRGGQGGSGEGGSASVGTPSLPGRGDHRSGRGRGNDGASQQRNVGVTTADVAYGGGKGVQYSSAGRGGSNLQKKKNGNPLAGLFKKKSKGGSEVLNFRDISSNRRGGRKRSLWDIISKRYDKVETQNRLLEYLPVP